MQGQYSMSDSLILRSGIPVFDVRVISVDLFHINQLQTAH